MTNVIPNNLSDEEILAIARDCLRSGKGRQAFELFVKKHRRFALNLAYQYTADREDAEDLAQEGFLKLYKALRRYEKFTSARGLLGAIIRNACLNYLKRRKLAGDIESLHMESKSRELTAKTSTPEEMIVANETAATVKRAIQTLTPSQQESVRLRYFLGLSYEEIAEVLGISVNHVGVLIHQSLKQLKRILGDTVSP